MVLYHPPPPTLGLRDHCGRLGRKTVRARGGWLASTRAQSYFSDTESSCTRELMVTMTAYCSMHKPAQHQDRENPSVKRAGRPEVSLLTEELRATDSCWERKNQCSLRMQPLVGWACSSGRPHIQEYMGSTNWTSWILKKKEGRYKLGWAGNGENADLRGIGAGGEYNRNTLYVIIKEIIIEFTISYCKELKISL